MQKSLRRQNEILNKNFLEQSFGCVDLHMVTEEESSKINLVIKSARVGAEGVFEDGTSC